MNARTLRALLAALVMAACAWPAVAQAPSPASSPAPADTAGDSLKSLVEKDLLPAAGGFAYNPQGRRDPFVSLLKPVSADQGARTRKQGMEGFLVQEVALKGVVKMQKGYRAMLLGTDGKSYFVSVGQRLYDGVIVAIDAGSVTFRQEVTDPLTTVRSRDVRKTLYPTEEARQ